MSELTDKLRDLFLVARVRSEFNDGTYNNLLEQRELAKIHELLLQAVELLEIKSKRFPNNDIVRTDLFLLEKLRAKVSSPTEQKKDEK